MNNDINSPRRPFKLRVYKYRKYAAQKHRSMIRISFILSFIICITSISFTLLKYTHDQPEMFINNKITERRPLPVDEFIKKKLADEELNRIFFFAPQNATNNQIPDKMWTCSNSSEALRNTKLIHSQMMASEGLLVQALLRAYNEYCGASVVLMSYCIDLGFEYMHDNETWVNGRTGKRSGEHCRVATSKSRRGDDWKRFSINTAFLIENDVDILGGYVPWGSHYYWTPQIDSHSHETVTAQYIIFLRDPLLRWIRETVLQNARQQSPKEIFRIMMQNLQKDSVQGKHRERFSNSLISPAQKEWIALELVDMTYERRVNMTLQNLSREPILVGLVEQLTPSFEMLQHLIDPEGRLDNLFSFLVSRNETELDERGASLVELVHDEFLGLPAGVQSKVGSYLQYEYEIYRYAVQLHSLQYESWKRMNKRSFASAK